MATKCICPNCSECIPTRLIVNHFIAHRNQNAVSGKISLLVLLLTEKFEPAHYKMYLRYLNQKYGQGDMTNSTYKYYLDLLTSSWSNTLFIEFSIDKQLATAH